MSAPFDRMSPDETARWYGATYGWPVFPCRLVRRPSGKLDKVPLIKDWPNAASTDPAVIERWWRQWPDAVISFVTGKRSGIIILDIDIRPDRCGLDTLDELGVLPLPTTPIVHTASGGIHLYFRRSSLEIRNSAALKASAWGSIFAATEGRPCCRRAIPVTRGIRTFISGLANRCARRTGWDIGRGRNEPRQTDIARSIHKTLWPRLATPSGALLTVKNTMCSIARCSAAEPWSARSCSRKPMPVATSRRQPES
jgi:hypothetical protein